MFQRIFTVNSFSPFLELQNNGQCCVLSSKKSFLGYLIQKNADNGGELTILGNFLGQSTVKRVSLNVGIQVFPKNVPGPKRLNGRLDEKLLKLQRANLLSEGVLLWVIGVLCTCWHFCLSRSLFFVVIVWSVFSYTQFSESTCQFRDVYREYSISKFLLLVYSIRHSGRNNNEISSIAGVVLDKAPSVRQLHEHLTTFRVLNSSKILTEYLSTR